MTEHTARHPNMAGNDSLELSLFLLSDDNFSPRQRTLLYEFALTLPLREIAPSSLPLYARGLQLVQKGGAAIALAIVLPSVTLIGVAVASLVRRRARRRRAPPELSSSQAPDLQLQTFR